MGQIIILHIYHLLVVQVCKIQVNSEVKLLANAVEAWTNNEEEYKYQKRFCGTKLAMSFL